MYEDIFKKIILPTITTFSWDHVGLNYMLSVCFFVFTQKLLVQQTHNSYFYPLFFFLYSRSLSQNSSVLPEEEDEKSCSESEACRHKLTVDQQEVCVSVFVYV